MSWDFSTDPDFQEQLDWMGAFVRREIWPLESIWPSSASTACAGRWRRCRSRSRSAACGRRICRRSWAVRASARCAWPDADILGTSPIAPLAFGNAAPDSGNSELLALAGTPEQKDRWLTRCSRATCAARQHDRAGHPRLGPHAAAHARGARRR